MNILIENTYYYPDMLGGTEHSVKLLAEALVRAGHGVAVLCTTSAAADGDCVCEEINGVKIYRYVTDMAVKKGITGKFRRFFGSMHNGGCRGVCEKIYRDFKPDVVHTNNLLFLSVYVWKFFSKKNIPVVHTLRDYYLLDHSSVYNRSNAVLNFFYRKFYRPVTVKYVDIVNAPSQFTLDIFLNNRYFKNSYAERVVDAVELDIEETERLIEEKQGREDKSVKFLFVGALGEYKGILNLLNAFSAVSGENITLTVCGRGEEELTVKQFCDRDNRITYLGQLSSEKLKEVYISHDVLVAPSVWEEPFGRIVIEGNQYGLPVIGSNRGGIKEIIETTCAGELFQYDDVGELSDKIKRFSDREFIKSFYPKIKETIGIYSLSSQVETFEKLYNRAVKTSK